MALCKACISILARLRRVKIRTRARPNSPDDAAEVLQMGRFRYKERDYMQKITTFLIYKVVKSRAPPVQPRKMHLESKTFPTKGQKLAKICLKIVFHALSFVLSGMFGELYGRPGDMYGVYLGDSQIIQEFV